VAKRDYSSQEIDLALAAFALEGGRQKPTEKLLRSAEIKVPYGTLRSWAYDVHAERYQQILLEVEQTVRARLADDYHRLARRSSELAEDVLDRIRALFTRKDKELAEVDEKLEDAEDQLRELNALIDVDQRQLAETLEIPDADALIEEILGDPGDVELDKVMVARLNSNYKRREGLVAEMQGLWRRREGLEVGFKDLAKILHEAGVMGGIATEKLNLLTGNATDRVEHSFPELQRALAAKGIRLLPGQGQAKPIPVKELTAAADG
jgi:hypothetical protein